MVKSSTLRWFGHIERMDNEEFVKKVYWSSVEGTNRRGRLLGRWEGKEGRKEGRREGIREKRRKERGQ